MVHTITGHLNKGLVYCSDHGLRYDPITGIPKTKLLNTVIQMVTFSDVQFSDSNNKNLQRFPLTTLQKGRYIEDPELTYPRAY